MKTGVKILIMTETRHSHTGLEGGRSKETPEGDIRKSEYKWYYSTGIDPKKHEEYEKAKKEKGAIWDAYAEI